MTTPSKKSRDPNRLGSENAATLTPDQSSKVKGGRLPGKQTPPTLTLKRGKNNS